MKRFAAASLGLFVALSASTASAGDTRDPAISKSYSHSPVKNPSEISQLSDDQLLRMAVEIFLELDSRDLGKTVHYASDGDDGEPGPFGQVLLGFLELGAATSHGIADLAGAFHGEGGGDDDGGDDDPPPFPLDDGVARFNEALSTGQTMSPPPR